MPNACKYIGCWGSDFRFSRRNCFQGVRRTNHHKKIWVSQAKIACKQSISLIKLMILNELDKSNWRHCQTASKRNQHQVLIFAHRWLGCGVLLVWSKSEVSNSLHSLITHRVHANWRSCLRCQWFNGCEWTWLSIITPWLIFWGHFWVIGLQLERFRGS